MLGDLKMKRLLLATTCLALSSAVSMAADMTTPMSTKAPAYAAPAFSWTGLYIGAQVGGGTLSDPGLNFEGGSQGTNGGKGAIAGGQIGYNYQDGNWVFGVEGEGYWSGIKNSLDSSFVNSTTGALTGASNTTFENRYDYTIAGRVGLAFDRTLVFAKGGWAWGNYRFSDSFRDISFPSSSFDNGTVTLDGALFGVGLEHALTRNWTVKFEYDYIAYGSKAISTTGCSTSGGTTGCFFNGSTPMSSNKQLFKFGANYLFDPLGPAVSRF
jgi:outer membrane immunogenic protein